MGASFRVKKRLIKFLCQNPHFTCVLIKTILKNSKTTTITEQVKGRYQA